MSSLNDWGVIFRLKLYVEQLIMNDTAIGQTVRRVGSYFEIIFYMNV